MHAENMESMACTCSQWLSFMGCCLRVRLLVYPNPSSTNVQARGARVVLLQTWGWLTGKNQYFANYLTMQARRL